jgi:hypothetical protein
MFCCASYQLSCTEQTELICDCENADISHWVRCISRLLVISFLCDFDVQILHSDVSS